MNVKSTAYFKMPFYLADTILNLGERVLFAYLLNGTHIFPNGYTPTISGMAHHLGVSRTVARKILNSLVGKEIISVNETGEVKVNDIVNRKELFI